MSSRQLLFKVLYRLGFTPWDGHPMSPTLPALVEGEGALAAGSALDIGCGTGDNSVYLANRGWQVTGVDYVSKPLEAARAKAAAA
jgi:2-polyprenyl-3-methyl-5-hydroxy-6-metoxy-1,4-benzoquinol methylase